MVEGIAGRIRTFVRHTIADMDTEGADRTEATGARTLADDMLMYEAGKVERYDGRAER